MSFTRIIDTAFVSERFPNHICLAVSGTIPKEERMPCGHLLNLSLIDHFRLIQYQFARRTVELENFSFKIHHSCLYLKSFTP